MIDRNIYPKIEIQGQQKQTHAGIGTTIDCQPRNGNEKRT